LKEGIADLENLDGSPLKHIDFMELKYVLMLIFTVKF